MGSKILQRCGACGLNFNAPREYAGKTVKCPQCRVAVAVVGDSSSSSALGAKPPAKPAPPKPAERSSPSVAAAPPTKPAAKPAPASAKPAAAGAPSFDIHVAPSSASVRTTLPGVKTASATTSATAGRGRRRSSGVNPLIAVAVGGGLLMLVVLASGAYFVSQLLFTGETTVADTTSTPADNPFLAPDEVDAQRSGELADDSVVPATPAGNDSGSFGRPGASWNVFVLDISDRERGEVQVKIDGQPHPVPQLGPVSFQLSAGDHQLQLTRPGFEPINHSFNLADNALASYTPRWQREGAGSLAPPTSVAGGQSNFDDWLQDFEEAKRRAVAENKDIFITFNGSDWCGWCIRLMHEVFFQQDFRDRIEDDFILVQIDSPRRGEARAKVQDLRRNQRLTEHFGVRGYPTIILTDSQGQAYAQTGYVEGGVEPFLRAIDQLKQSRAQRDELFAAVENAQGDARIKSAENAMAWLKENEVLQHYGPTLAGWLATALAEDPNNEQGQLEAFFELDWFARVMVADRTEYAELRPILDRLTNFNGKHKFRNGDRGARLNLLAAGLAQMHEQTAAAKSFADAGVACNPQDEELKETLARASRALAHGDVLGSGTGFVVAPGYIMTNHHVIEGDGKPFVRIAGRNEPVPARIIAKDDKLDVAILQVSDPEVVSLTPLAMNTYDMGRGSPIAVFGYPLGDELGGGLKLTKGIVSALADDENEGMMMLDCRVNPGNSGGPLCDTSGRVIGLVTAKTGGHNVDSYGMARPVEKLEPFMKRHIPNFSTSPPVEPSDVESWGKVDRAIGASVLMIVMKK